MDDKRAQDLLKAATFAHEQLKVAQDKIAALEESLKREQGEKAAANLAIEMVREGRIDPEDASSFAKKAVEQGIDFVKRAMDLDLLIPESFGELVEKDEVDGVKTAGNGYPTVSGKEISRFEQSFYELKHTLYGDEFPYDSV